MTTGRRISYVFSNLLSKSDLLNVNLNNFKDLVKGVLDMKEKLFQEKFEEKLEKQKGKGDDVEVDINFWTRVAAGMSINLLAYGLVVATFLHSHELVSTIGENLPL